MIVRTVPIEKKGSILNLVVLCLLLLTGPGTGAQDTTAVRESTQKEIATMPQAKHLVSFDDSDSGEWFVVNDGVMGGISRSAIRATENGTGVFAGDLSLENNGGFASIRYLLNESRDLSEATGLLIRVRGDGRTYQLRLRDDDRFDGAAFRASFETRDAEWVEARIPFDDFVPTFRGRTLTNVPPLDRENIRQIGIMLADKNAGPFSLEIDFISSWTDSSHAH